MAVTSPWDTFSRKKGGPGRDTDTLVQVNRDRVGIVGGGGGRKRGEEEEKETNLLIGGSILGNVY